MPDPSSSLPAEAPREIPERTKTIYRYAVPVDDQPHQIKLRDNPRTVAVDTEQGYAVEFWAEHDEARMPMDRTFRVYGTGHPIPSSAVWWGTTARVNGLVWHLYETFETENEAPRG